MSVAPQIWFTRYATHGPSQEGGCWNVYNARGGDDYMAPAFRACEKDSGANRLRDCLVSYHTYFECLCVHVTRLRRRMTASRVRVILTNHFFVHGDWNHGWLFRHIRPHHTTDPSVLWQSKFWDGVENVSEPCRQLWEKLCQTSSAVPDIPHAVPSFSQSGQPRLAARRVKAVVACS